MTWLPLSNLVHGLHSRAREIPEHDDLRSRAALLAVLAYGPQRTLELPELVNIAALALSMPRLTVHTVRPGVSSLVDETDLHSLPDEPPRLLRTGWIAEVREPGRESLFGSTCSLGCYELDGTYYLIGLDHPDGARVARWRPQWRGGELEAGIVREDSGGLIDDLQEHAEWAREAARWAVVFAMLLDAHGAPIRTEDEGPTLPGRRHGKARPGRPWGVRRVSLTEGAVARPGGHSDGGETEIDQRIAVEVRVRGHLKRQRYGEGREQVRWIYVESYEARRWLSPRPQRVVVS